MPWDSCAKNAIYTCLDKHFKPNQFLRKRFCHHKWLTEFLKFLCITKCLNKYVYGRQILSDSLFTTCGFHTKQFKLKWSATLCWSVKKYLRCTFFQNRNKVVEMCSTNSKKYIWLTFPYFDIEGTQILLMAIFCI